MGNIAFLLHFTGVAGVIGTLFYLIYSHQFQYAYVFNHSSNELPVYYMISCFWEGQEGSFLLWTFWHAVLGLILLRNRSEWRNLVLAVLASVNLILASMILGVNVSQEVVQSLLTLTLAGLVAWLWLQQQKKKEPVPLFLTAASVLALIAAALTWSQGGGFFRFFSFGAVLSEPQGSIHLLAILFWWMVVILFGIAVVRSTGKGARPVLRLDEALAGFTLIAIAMLVMLMQADDWKIGSTPFMLLRDAFPDAPVFAENPDFVPMNGNGLNSLLQNYWMVIHPPTLFLGFASTTIPFAFVIAGLLRRDFDGWIRPVMPWLLFSGLVLGTGIIMGGYWAYETLNFGGYWNWDAVENSSFVPWLGVIIALHCILLLRRSGLFLHLTIFSTLSAFILVLYSTFLTRSGILGDTSVHTFTDLGLSGQLLLLLFFYLFAGLFLYLYRSSEIPSGSREMPLISPEVFMFFGICVLATSGIAITLTTSVPVINSLIGTAMAPPDHVTLFYYEENVWFGILLALLAGTAQFLYWKRSVKGSIGAAVMRPFIMAVLSASVVIVLLALSGRDFSFDDELNSWLEGTPDDGPVTRAVNVLSYGFFVLADEILLMAGLFLIFSSADIFIHLLRKNSRTRRATGGALAHLGFGLMLVGILLSSGFDRVVSLNPDAKELSSFPKEEQGDNILLVKNQPRLVPGYEITYLGQREARSPVSDLRFFALDPATFRVHFRDASGDWFMSDMPLQLFAAPGATLPQEAAVKDFLDKQVEFLRPPRINARQLFGVRFTPLTGATATSPGSPDTSRSFILYPEAEVNNKDKQIISHPSRRIALSGDLYVHVSSLPKEVEEEGKEPQFKYYTFELGVGESAQTAAGRVWYRTVTPDDTAGTPYAVIARAHLEIEALDGKTYTAQPLYRIGNDNKVALEGDYVSEVSSFFYFTGINTTSGKVELRVQEEVKEGEDFIVLKALDKPWINVLWLGTIVMLTGFGIAIRRRYVENRAGAPISQPDAGA